MRGSNNNSRWGIYTAYLRYGSQVTYNSPAPLLTNKIKKGINEMINHEYSSRGNANSVTWRWKAMIGFSSSSYRFFLRKWS